MIDNRLFQVFLVKWFIVQILSKTISCKKVLPKFEETTFILNRWHVVYLIKLNKKKYRVYEYAHTHYTY